MTILTAEQKQLTHLLQGFSWCASPKIKGKPLVGMLWFEHYQDISAKMLAQLSNIVHTILIHYWLWMRRVVLGISIFLTFPIVPFLVW